MNISQDKIKEILETQVKKGFRTEIEGEAKLYLDAKTSIYTLSFIEKSSGKLKEIRAKNDEAYFKAMAEIFNISLE